MAIVINANLLWFLPATIILGGLYIATWGMAIEDFCDERSTGFAQNWIVFHIIVVMVLCTIIGISKYTN